MCCGDQFVNLLPPPPPLTHTHTHTHRIPSIDSPCRWTSSSQPQSSKLE